MLSVPDRVCICVEVSLCLVKYSKHPVKINQQLASVLIFVYNSICAYSLWTN